MEKSKKIAGMTVKYKVVLPNGYDPAKAYPGILGFGGGNTLATIAALQRHGSDKQAAADELGVSLRTLYNKLKEYGIS